MHAMSLLMPKDESNRKERADVCEYPREDRNEVYNIDCTTVASMAFSPA